MGKRFCHSTAGSLEGGQAGRMEWGTQGSRRREGTGWGPGEPLAALPALIYLFCPGTVAPRLWRESNA